MKKIVIGLFSVLLTSVSSFGLSFFACGAQMADRKVVQENIILTMKAPSLVFSSLGALKIAKHRPNTERLSLNFDVTQLLKGQTAYVILDGRSQGVQMNIHLSLKYLNSDKVLVQMKDTLSDVKTEAVFQMDDDGATLQLSKVNSRMDLTCYLH